MINSDNVQDRTGVQQDVALSTSGFTVRTFVKSVRMTYPFSKAQWNAFRTS